MTIKIGAETFGLLVDGVFDTQEIIVKPVAPVLRHIAVFSGMTILEDGTVAMILDTVGLARAMGTAASPPMAAPTESEELADTVETVDFLTFRVGQAALKAVPLRMLTRIESIDLSTIETTDDRTLVQHRGHILPLVPAGAAAISPTGHEPVLIFETAQGAVGLVVDQVVDIVQVPTDIALTSASGRSVGGAVIDGQVTEFVELGQFLSAVLVAGAAREAKLRVLLIDGNARHVAFYPRSSAILDMLSPPCRAPPMRLSFNAGKRASIPSWLIYICRVSMDLNWPNNSPRSAIGKTFLSSATAILCRRRIWRGRRASVSRPVF